MQCQDPEIQRQIRHRPGIRLFTVRLSPTLLPFSMLEGADSANFTLQAPLSNAAGEGWLGKGTSGRLEGEGKAEARGRLSPFSALNSISGVVPTPAV